MTLTNTHLPQSQIPCLPPWTLKPVPTIDLLSIPGRVLVELVPPTSLLLKLCLVCLSHLARWTVRSCMESFILCWSHPASWLLHLHWSHSASWLLRWSRSTSFVLARSTQFPGFSFTGFVQPPGSFIFASSIQILLSCVRHPAFSAQILQLVDLPPPQTSGPLATPQAH